MKPTLLLWLFVTAGGAAAEHLPAIWERRARLPGQRAGQARDADPHPPPGHRLQVRAPPRRSSIYSPVSLWTRTPAWRATPLATSGPAQNATTPHTTHAPNPPIRVHRSYHKPWVRPALSRARCRLLAQQTDNYPRPGCSYSYVSSVSTDHSCITTARRSCSEILTVVSCACSICRWEIVGSSDEVEYSPFPVPKHGLPVRLWRENRTVDRKGVCESDDVEDIIV